MIPTARNAHHIGLNVPDLDRAVAFFVAALGAEELFRWGPFADPQGDAMADKLRVDPRASVKGAMLRFGPVSNVELLEYNAPDQAARPPRTADPGVAHLGIFVDDLDAATTYLRARPEVVWSGAAGPAPLDQPHAGLSNVFLLTEWGLLIELLTYPPGLPYERQTEGRMWGPAPAWSNRAGGEEARDVGAPEGAGERETADHQQIADLLYRYCLHADLYEPGPLAALFTEDCAVTLGASEGGPIEGRAALEEQVRRNLGRFAATSHHNTNVRVVLDGDDATAMSYIYAWHAFADGTPDLHLYGQYHDRLRRTPEGWRIAERRLLTAGHRGGGGFEGVPIGRTDGQNRSRAGGERPRLERDRRADALGRTAKRRRGALGFWEKGQAEPWPC